MTIKHIVLDLDHTLILSLTAQEIKTRKVPNSLKVYKFDKYYIFERPRLEEFLKELTSKYKISVWTAASADYGQFIVKNIIEPYAGKIYLFFHSLQCEESAQQMGGVIKHLDCLHKLSGKSFSRTNTILIDDNEEVLKQNNYVFHIKPFNLEQKDFEFARILKKIERANK